MYYRGNSMHSNMRPSAVCRVLGAVKHTERAKIDWDQLEIYC
jgi:hypothetical protein